MCDTEPSANSFSTGLVPTNDEINSCTGKKYQGVQYNIMNYSSDRKKFTPGQRQRALEQFLSYRGSLVRSLGATPIDDTSRPVNLTPTTCNIGDTGRYSASGIGIVGVKIGDIHNASNTPGIAYIDYTKETCGPVSYTDIKEGESTPLTLSKQNKNAMLLEAWIDYNNDGDFSQDERLFGERVEATRTSFVFDITPPATAVKDKYLRLRVKGDVESAAKNAPCSNPSYGDVEDYAIRIVSKNNDNNNDDDNDNNNPTDGTNEGRVGINTDKPSVTLDVRETNIDLLPRGTQQGVIFPRFTTQERATFRNIKEGTMIYNTTLKCLEIYTENNWKCFRYSE